MSLLNLGLDSDFNTDENNNTLLNCNNNNNEIESKINIDLFNETDSEEEDGLKEKPLLNKQQLTSSINPTTNNNLSFLS